MELTKNVFNLTAQNATAFSRLKEYFSSFVQAAEELAKDRRALGITVIKSDTAFQIDTSFAGTNVRYQMFPAYDDKYRLIGKIYVTRQSHRLIDNPEYLGDITFDQSGISNIEDTNSGAFVELYFAAPDVIMHFFHQAILHPVAPPK